jgi:hypothetical protein
MRAFITICHKNHEYDPTLSYLFKAIEKVHNLDDCDVVIMPITYLDNYIADLQLMEAIEMSGKKIVIVDFVEYGWDVKNTDHMFGLNTHCWKEKFKNPEFDKLDDFIKRNLINIAVYFKRELMHNPTISNLRKLCLEFKVLPAEYPGVNNLPDYTPAQSYEDFTNRPIDVIMFWGLSNPSRPLLHGEFVKQSATNGQHLVSNLDHVTVCQKRGDKRMVVMAHIPDFSRESILKLLHIQSLAKISISMNGAGKKCFRHAESSYNSVMAIQENDLEWSYPWIDGYNSINLPNRTEGTLIDEYLSYHAIMDYLDRPKELYAMYLNGIDNWNNYEVNKYSRDYILKEIQNAI